jgi:hypothetical protein
MKVERYQNQESLTKLIDEIGPLNNEFRFSTSAIKKIEILWDIGKKIDNYLLEYDLKLHELLYKIYDPYSTIKQSYITRDLGSYSYRIYKYFEKKEDIRDMLRGLKSYSLFREAIPLLFNKKYHLTGEEKAVVYKLITSEGNQKEIKHEIEKFKKSINPVTNPRNQRSDEFNKEKEYLENIRSELKDFYKKNDSISTEIEILGSKENRESMVRILMALSSESFINKIEGININSISDYARELLIIAQSDNSTRARFRRWVMNSNTLLRTAEAIHTLDNIKYFKSFREKFLMDE